MFLLNQRLRKAPLIINNSTMIKQALILAGGLGSRLGGLTKETPKPMLLVGGRPFIEYLIWNLKRQGINKIVISIGHKAKKFINYIESELKYIENIVYVQEYEPMGTGGAVKLASSELDSEFLVINGDSLFDLDYMNLIKFSKEFPNSMVAVALRQVTDNSRYGKILIDGEKIKEFIEKKDINNNNLINGGVYVIKKEVLELIPDGNSSLEHDLFPKLAHHELIIGKKCDGYFIDIGIPLDYNRSQIELPKWKKLASR